ncbi:MAG: hypothetical protein QNK03_00395 [Myxococcota bacterium]|nr:hypothetical protein [Myxococcota bacterium]
MTGRILVADGDPALERVLVDLLAAAGHPAERLARGRAATPADLLLLGLPAPDGLSPRALQDADLVLLAGPLPLGELERWLERAPRWTLLPKPVPLPRLLARVAKTFGPAFARTAI